MRLVPIELRPARSDSKQGASSNGRRAAAISAASAAVAVWLALCSPADGQDFLRRVWPFDKLDLRSQSPEENADESADSSDTPLLGQYTTFTGLNVIALHGVGLVTGLDGTGEDPPPSSYRTRLLRDMRNRGVKNPNSILQSPDTALVLIKAYMPPLARKGDKFDIEVYVPQGSKTTSLNGGWLLETYLSEQQVAPGGGRLLQGHIYAKAEGPILLSIGGSKDNSNAGMLRRGRVLGGATALREREMAIYLRNDYSGVKQSREIAARIGERFYQYNKHGQREPLAEGETDRKIRLGIQDRYRDNFPRYLQVIRNIARRETVVAQRVRMQKLEQELNNPLTSEKAALQLEAIGHESIPILKDALGNPALEARFHAAVALAYLGDSSGVKVLAEAAREEPAFRVFALAALAAVDDSQSYLELKALTNETSAETRYGAFRALTTMDENDPFVKGELLNDQFKLHVLDTEGPPLVHLTNRRKAEVVLFGADQRFVPPMTVRAGRYILVKAIPGRDEVIISRFKPGEPDLQETVSSRIADVIRTVASSKFNASFPDVAQMLVQADQQQNLPSRLAIDALPKTGRIYRRPDGNESKTRIGTPQSTPNLFDTDEDSQDDQPSEDEPADLVDGKAADGGAGMASFADAAKSHSETKTDNSSDSSIISRLNPLRLLRKTPPDEPGDSN